MITSAVAGIGQVLPDVGTPSAASVILGGGLAIGCSGAQAILKLKGTLAVLLYSATPRPPSGIIRLPPTPKSSRRVSTPSVTKAVMGPAGTACAAPRARSTRSL